ncbi:larval cuticle protein 4 [Teleopsis dalmanni]|uniref:larval cuticle protein 4 n=1 Tax=Teleopsis dalmanni TaxID=139649 RepID=UPI0018CE940A|nr:larval cuticle protein 4 [Teleopsis dalmanni]
MHLKRQLEEECMELLISTLFAFALADIDSTITRFASQINIDGTYAFDTAQSNGAAFREFGIGGQYAKGAYEYFSPEGEHVQVVYTADENGFQPESNFLPTPPPIPEYILKAIKYIEEHPTAEELADREVRAKQL